VPPSFLSVFSVLDTEVFLFLLSPSSQYFFDMVSPGQMDRIALKKDRLPGCQQLPFRRLHQGLDILASQMLEQPEAADTLRTEKHILAGQFLA